MLNPTNCDAGGSAAGRSAAAGPIRPIRPRSAPTQSALRSGDRLQQASSFKPKLSIRLYGRDQAGKNPRIRAIAEARNGDANIGRTALTMPHSLFLDQGHIGTVCTRVQLAAQKCPKASIYGHARGEVAAARREAERPVYLVSSNDKLPNLVADLRGQVNIQLRGVIGSKSGGLKTVFHDVPDVPVRKFILNMKGGKKSLLVNSTNTCEKKQRAVLNIKGQNGKKVKNNKFRLNISSCGKKSSKKK